MYCHRYQQWKWTMKSSSCTLNVLSQVPAMKMKHEVKLLYTQCIVTGTSNENEPWSQAPVDSMYCHRYQQWKWTMMPSSGRLNVLLRSTLSYLPTENCSFWVAFSKSLSYGHTQNYHSNINEKVRVSCVLWSYC